MKEEKDKKKVKKDSKEKTKPVKSIRKKVIKENDMEIVNKSVDFNLLEVIIIILITGIVVSITSGLIVYNNYDKLTIQKEQTNSELSEFVENYEKIIGNYVEEVDKKALIDAAIEGMYNYLGDGYSMYLNKEDTDELEEQLTGEYTGIGIEIRTEVKEDGTYQAVINRVFSDTPAKRAGLQAGDILIKVDDIDVTDSAMVANTIKNGNKESYSVTYLRDGIENTVTIKREKVYIDSVSSTTYDNIGYIKIDTFSATTKDQITKILDSFDSSINSLIIDVRNNSGGYLNTAYNVADLFIEKGKVIYQLKDRDGKISKFEAKSGVYKNYNKIAVLINGNSASASEILAIALKESKDAVIIGTKSYGKGTVQDTDLLKSGAMVKYTTAYWLSPKGNSINIVGIVPDIEVTDIPNQLEEAIKAVK